LGLLAVGGLAVAVILAILNYEENLFGPLIVLGLGAIGAVLLGWLATGLSLLRSTGPVRAVGAVV